LKFAYIFSKYLVYNKYKVNLNSIYLLQNCLLILVCKILRYKRILFVRKYIDFENKKINNTTLLKKKLLLRFELNID